MLLAWVALVVMIYKLRSHRNLHGRARFAGMIDLGRKGFLGGGDDGIVVGQMNGRLLRLRGQQFAQLRQEHHLGHVRHRGAEDARTGGRVEALGVAQRILHRLIDDGLIAMERRVIRVLDRGIVFVGVAGPRLVDAVATKAQVFRQRPNEDKGILLHQPDAAAHRLHCRGEDEAFDLFGALAAGHQRRDDAELAVHRMGAGQPHQGP